MKLMPDEIYNTIYKVDPSEGKSFSVQAEETYIKCILTSEKLYSTIKNLLDQQYNCGKIGKRERDETLRFFEGVLPQKNMSRFSRWINKLI